MCLKAPFEACAGTRSCPGGGVVLGVRQAKCYDERLRPGALQGDNGPCLAVNIDVRPQSSVYQRDVMPEVANLYERGH